MAKKLASIIDSSNILLLSDGGIIPLDSPKFAVWLESNNSFRFDYGLGGKDGFTARKEKSGYWYAYRTMSGKLHKKYIGNSLNIGLAKLSEIAESIITQKDKAVNVLPKKELQNPLPNKQLPTEITENAQVILSEMQRAIEALTRRVEELERAKKPESSPVEELDGYTTLLERRVSELEDVNRRLTTQLEEMREGLIAAHGQNVDAHSQTAEVLKENVELGARLQRREAELETAQQRIAQLEQAQNERPLQPDQTQEPQPVALDPKAIDEFLASLKLGKQSPDYKAAKKWVAKFVEFCKNGQTL